VESIPAFAGMDGGRKALIFHTLRAFPRRRESTAWVSAKLCCDYPLDICAKTAMGCADYAREFWARP